MRPKSCQGYIKYGIIGKILKAGAYMRSMTGYGRGVASKGEITVNIEVKTVNHKFFDCNIKMPRSFLFLEDEIKKQVGKDVTRGHIDVFVTQERTASAGSEYRVDLKLAENYMLAANKIASYLDIPNDITVSSLIKNSDITTLSAVEDDAETIRELVLSALTDAMKALVAMRESEGLSQVKDFTEKLANITASLEKVKSVAPYIVKDYQEKLQSRINALLTGTTAEDTRLAAEVAIFADKCSVDEEITRLTSHIATMKGYLTLNEPVGRKLDFLVQEFNREANTIGSKANSLGITSEVLNMKNEIEKMREQAQNVE